MNKRLLIPILLGLYSSVSPAIEVVTPQELQTSSIHIDDPDRHINTLGTVSFHVDLSASHDDLLALKVRRSDLKLKDGRSFTAFGVHKKSGVIIVGGGDIQHISVASIEGKEAQVLFYGKDNEIISPKPKNVAVFDTDFKPLSFTYTPLQTPGSLTVPVTIALDTSTSMGGHMSTVVTATKEFMRELPSFTKCSLLTFGTNIAHLSSRADSCPSSTYLLSKPLKADGATALYKAIDTGFKYGALRKKRDFPNIVVVVTDGVNTMKYGQTLASLTAIKKASNSKLFVFWAGSYAKGHLQGLADLELVSTQNLGSELDDFFRTLGVSLSGLQTLHIGQ